MGNKINANYFRITKNKNWLSRWVGEKNYLNYLKTDVLIRSILIEKINNNIIDRIYTEHLTNYIIITIISNKAGQIIGKDGKKLKKIKNYINKKFNIKKTFIKIKEPSKEKLLIINYINILKNKIISNINYKKIISDYYKILINKYKITGIKTIIKGRINGAEIAKREKYTKGNIPINKIKSDITFYNKTVKSKYGTIGIKIWINNEKKKIHKT